MWTWLKQLHWVVKHSAQAFTDARLYTKALEDKICALEKLIKDRTTIGVDVGFRDPSYVIVMGRYRNADYVRTYTVHPTELTSLIEMLRAMEKTATVRFVDAPPDVRAIFKRELP